MCGLTFCGETEGSNIQQFSGLAVLFDRGAMEPLNNGHIGPGILSFIERLSSLRRSSKKRKVNLKVCLL